MLNLGILQTDRILVFGGPYGNLEATQELFNIADKEGIAADYIFCTGDIVAYCADPQQCTEIIKNKNIYTIQGNCENSLANDKEDCGCGFEEDSACDLLFKKWFSYCQKNLNKQNLNWFSTIPKHIKFKFGGKSFSILHGSATNISEFIFKSYNDKKFTPHFNIMKTDCIISGHCGLPFTKKIGDYHWHNAGVIGMPANDGTSRAWYSIISIINDKICFNHKAYDYDVQKSYNKMKQADMPVVYADALITGIWPSTDILPQKEKDKTGVAIKEHQVIWKK